jgi:predicted transcriptional regulator
VEIELFISQYVDLKDEIGRQRIVRNGYLPEREIQSGIGLLAVKAPRVRDRHRDQSKRIHFIDSATLSTENLQQKLMIVLTGLNYAPAEAAFSRPPS